jgi:type IV secretory pathway VirB9-like protein
MKHDTNDCAYTSSKKAPLWRLNRLLRRINMKKITLAITLMPWLAFTAWAGQSEVRATTLNADFTGSHQNQVYSIFSKTDYVTTVVLPKKRSAKHVVCGDIKAWSLQCDGKFIFIKPLRHSLHTSLTIVTDNNRVYIFNLIEQSLKSRTYEITAKVNIKDEQDNLHLKRDEPHQFSKESNPTFNDYHNHKSRLTTAGAVKVRYRVKKNRFHIEEVYDDGIFTYIYMPHAQVKPAIFIKRGRHKEPVKYVDNGDRIVVHGVIHKREKLVLVVGNRTSKIVRKR